MALCFPADRPGPQVCEKGSVSAVYRGCLSSPGFSFGLVWFVLEPLGIASLMLACFLSPSYLVLLYFHDNFGLEFISLFKIIWNL